MSNFTDDDLIKKLLSIGGTRVAMHPEGETDLDEIVSRGHLTRGSDARRIKGGDPIRCHSNSGDLWKKNRDTVSIETGYALSADGIWRQHSWVAWKDQPGILETTAVPKGHKRVAYFGFPLTDAEAETFAKANQSRRELHYPTLTPPDPWGETDTASNIGNTRRRRTVARATRPRYTPTTSMGRIGR